MTKRQRTISQEDKPIYNSITAGMKDFTIKVIKKGEKKPEYLLQRAATYCLAVESIKEAYPGCKYLVIDSKEAFL